MSALIGALRVTLSADTAKFQAGMKSAELQAKATQSSISRSMGGLKAGIAGFVGALSVGMLTSVIKSALDYAGSLGEVSQQLGVTTKDLQVFRFAGGQAGISSEEMDKALGKLTITMGKASLGAKEPAKAFAAIGISLDDLRGKDTGQVFRMISDGLAQVSDRSQRAALEVAFFGKTGAKLDTVLAGGSGAINELANAAEKLGIVLSDKQIQDADKTADKLDAMKTVLSANIAGQVANNADAILGLANALMQIVVWAGKAASAMATFYNFAAKQKFASEQAAQFGAKNPNVATGIVKALGAVNPLLGGAASLLMPNPKGGGRTSVTTKLAPATIAAPAMPSLDVPKFLAGGGGGKKGGGGKGPADTSLRDAHQLDQEMRRASIDILRAQQDLATNFDDRNTIAVQILDAERAAYAAELAYEVKAGEKTQAVASQLVSLYDQKDSLERQKILVDEAAERAEEAARYQDKVMDLDMEVLQSRAQLAETASEQRAIELQILDLAYRRRKAALDAAIAQEKDAAALQRLELERDRLGETYGNDRQGVINSTRNPIEEWAASVPKSAAEITEALQGIQANGLDTLSDSIADVVSGTKSLKDAFSDVAQSIIADLIKMSVRMLIFRALSGIMGGAFGGSGGGFMPGAAESLPGWGSTGDLGSIPRFAGGGSFNILGRGGTDRNLLSLNGLPIARVSHGERINIANDNVNGGSSIVINQHFAPNFAGNAATREDLMMMGQITKAETMKAVNEQRRRR